MTSLDVTPDERTSRRALPSGRPTPAWAVVFGSRLLVLAVGWLAALLTRRVPLWWQFDPARVTLHQGALGNVLSAPIVRWDSIHYLQIAQHGYDRAYNTPFYPLYPLLIHVVGWVTGSLVVAGFLISAGAFSLALVLLHRLVKEELDARAARSTVLLLALAPLSFFFTAVYTESLFLALIVASFLLARRNRFGWAGAAAAAATLTHVEGILLVAPLAIMFRRAWLEDRPARFRPWQMGALALPPVALGGFFAYVHSLGYAWLAPVQNANTNYYGRTLVGTPVMLWRALSAGVTGLWQTVHGVAPVEPNAHGTLAPGLHNFVLLIALVVALVCLVLAWRRLPPEYGVFASLCLLVMTSSAVKENPLLSFDRYTLVVFPLWVAAAWGLERYQLMRPALIASIALLVLCVIEFARWAFIA